MDVPFRTATEAERTWYVDRLYPLQDCVLAIAGEYEDRALAGGTALARAHLHHRYSDDLDLFTQADRIDTLAAAVLGRVERAGFAVEFERRSTTFVRAVVIQDNVRLRVDFANDVRLVLPAERSVALKIRVYSLRDLAANKISAYEDRAEAKDVINLYYVTEHLPWSTLFADAERKRVPPAYDTLQSMLAQPVTGMALLVNEIAAPDYERFVAPLRTALTADIKRKALAAAAQLRTIVSDLLWDTPPEARTISASTVPVLRRRLARLALPKRIALMEKLAEFDAPEAV